MTILKVEGLCKAYPEFALRDVSFSMESGSVMGFIGRNGAGKTTTLKSLLHLVHPDAGRITLLGKDMDRDEQEIRRSIGFVSGGLSYYPRKHLRQITDATRRFYPTWDEKMYRSCLERFRLSEDKRTSELSEGMKVKYQLALAMSHGAKLLILDEPTSMLDPLAARSLLDTVERINRELGVAVLLTEHRLDAVFPVCDRVLVMDGGKLRIDGAPAKIAAQLAQETEKERLYYGLPAPVRICGELGADPIPLSVRQARGYLKTILKDAKPQAEEPVKQEPEREDKPVLSCKEVWMRYASTEPDVLRGAELQLYKKEHLCLLGGNGAGKTTLLSCLIGTAKPQRGKIKLQKNCRLAMLPQRPQALFTQDDVLSDLLEVGNEADARAWAEKLELTGLLDRHPFDLSGGELQRAALCKLLLRNADVLLLDEPTKGLDAYAKAELGEILKKLNADGVSILTVTHDLDFAASFADRCAMMFDGRVISADEPHRFFSGNRYYTTDANRIAGSWFPRAITCEEVVRNCREAGR